MVGIFTMGKVNVLIDLDGWKQNKNMSGDGPGTGGSLDWVDGELNLNNSRVTHHETC